MAIYRLSICQDDDYPAIDWKKNAAMADLWLEVHECRKAGAPVEEILAKIDYVMRLNRRWTKIDCLAMYPGIGISPRARTILEKLKIPGMQFLEFSVKGKPYYQFYTDRRIDCLDRANSQIEFYPGSGRVMRVHRYCFVETLLRPCDVFTVPELSRGMFFWVQQTFFTEPAREAIENSALKGFHFEELPV